MSKSEQNVANHEPPMYVAPVDEPAELRKQSFVSGWLLWDQRGFIFSCAWKALLIAIVVALLIPVQYDATTRLVPGQETNSSMSMLAALAGRTGGGTGLDISSLLGTKTPGAFYVSILQSRTVEDELIKRFDLRKAYGTPYYADARRRLASLTKVSEDTKSGVITLSVRDHEPERAAELARAYVEAVNRLSSQLNTSAAHRERLFLEQRLRSEAQELDAAEKDLSDFSSKYSAIDIKEQGRAMVGAAANLQGEMIAAESQLSGLQQIYSENNVRVRSLEARITELKRQLEKLGGTYTTPGTLSDSNDAQNYPAIRSLPALGYRYAQFYRRAKVAETVYDLLTQQYELAKVQEAKELPVIMVMDPAEVPERKSFPPRIIIVLLSVLASMLFAVLWILQKARWDELPPDHVQKQFASEIRGEISVIGQKLASHVPARLRRTPKNPEIPPVDISDSTD